jgi:quercetin dioxygenase-like cupin family protein
VKIVSHGDRSAQYGGRFTGEVDLEMLHAASEDDRPDIALVHFHDGAVTNWHTHPGGQHLFVHQGRARVGTDVDGEVALEPGALVVTPAGERHWHGATDGADASIVAVTWGTTQWEDAAPF